MSKPKTKNELSHADALAEAAAVWDTIDPRPVHRRVTLRPGIDYTVAEYAKARAIHEVTAGARLRKLAKGGKLGQEKVRIWKDGELLVQPQLVYWPATLLPPPDAE